MQGAPHHIILATAVLALAIGGVEGMVLMECACMAARACQPLHGLRAADLTSLGLHFNRLIA